MTQDILTLKEAAEYLRVGYQTMLRLAKKGKLPLFKVGGQWRIKKEDLERYITETKRRPFLGEHLVYFKMGVLNRYKKEAQYFFEEEQFSGRFGIRQEYLPQKPEAASITMNAIGDVRFQKVPLLGGDMAVCLNNDYYFKSVGRIPYEYAHWHNYRIHFPRLPEDK